MGLRNLTAFECFCVKTHDGAVDRVTRGGSSVYLDSEVDRCVAQERAVRAKADAEYFTSAEFRQEVVDALVAGGATLEQATNRTRDQVRLFNEAKLLGLL